MHTSMREARQLGVFGLWGETLPTARTFTGLVVGVTKNRGRSRRMSAVGISFSGSNKIRPPPFPCPIAKITQSVFAVARGECKDNGSTAQRDAHGAEFAKYISFNVRHTVAGGFAART